MRATRFAELPALLDAPEKVVLLNEFKERVGGSRLDVDGGLNTLCSAIVRGQLPALPIDLGWA
jgi:hypothetical protein